MDDPPTPSINVFGRGRYVTGLTTRWNGREWGGGCVWSSEDLQARLGDQRIHISRSLPWERYIYDDH